MAKQNIGDLHARITADSKGFNREMGRARRSSQNFSQKASDDFKRVGRGIASVKGAIGGLLAVFASRQLLRGIGLAIEGLDDIAKTARVVGISAQSLQELRFAAEQTGIETRGLDDSIRRLTRRAGELANSGAGPAAKAFKQLKIDVRDANGDIKSTDQLWNEIVESMGDVETTAQRSALAAQLFGDDFGPKLVPLLEMGRQGIEDLREEARDLGIVFDEEILAKAEKASDELNILRRTMAAKFTIVVADNLDNIRTVIEELISLTEMVGGLITNQRLAKGDFSGFRSTEQIDRYFDEVEEEMRKKIIGFSVEDFLERPQAYGGTIPTIIGGRAEMLEQLQGLMTRRGELEVEERMAARGLDPEGNELEGGPTGPRAEVDTSTGTGTGTGTGDRPVDEKERLAAEKAAEAEAKRLDTLRKKFEAMADPVAVFRQELTDLDEAYAKGEITNEVYQKAWQDIQARMSTATETTDEYAQAINDWADAVLESMNPYAEIEQQEAMLNAAKEAGILTTEEQIRIEKDLAEQRQEIADQLSGNNESIERMNSLLKDTGMAFASAFEQAIIDGKNLGGVLQGLSQDLLRLALRAMVLEPMVSGFSNFAGSFFGGSGATPTTPTPSFPTGPTGLAGGGQLQANTLTWVGERGPELIASNSPSRVINNHQARRMSGEQEIKVEIVNRGTPVEAVGSRASTSPDGLVVSVITDDMRRGGPISQGLSNLYGLQRRR